jgi:hypothetical protein
MRTSCTDDVDDDEVVVVVELWPEVVVADGAVPPPHANDKALARIAALERMHDNRTVFVRLIARCSW